MRVREEVFKSNLRLRVRNPVQHIRYFRDKMEVYSRNDLLLCISFPSSLKVVHNSLSPHSLYNFEEVSKVFLTQYASHQEAKNSSHHLLSIKMRPSKILKSNINSSKANLPKSPIAERTSLHSHSSVGCRFLTPYTSTSSKTMSLG